MIYIAETKEGERIEYRDPKRYFWILSLAAPVIPLLAVGLYFWDEKNPWLLALPIAYSFLLIPALDLLFGEDTSNPPAEIIEQMGQDPYYRILLHLSVPLFWMCMIVCAWVVGSQDLPWWAVLFVALSAGYSAGTAITVGHELGHKSNRLDRFSAMMANAVSGYGHFCIEHNKGHHTWVATPEDPASARLNESLFAFAMREIPGTLKRGWLHEKERLQKKGYAFLHWRNEVLQGYAVTLAVALVFLVTFGWIMLPYLVLHNAIGWYALTQANYVEHYGLKRKKLESGRYEPVAPHHSWNTNHIVSNLLLFHLQRHSDHHANPMRPYQALRNFDELPRLPSGYPGSFLLASIPPLWFRVMNPKVMAWAGGDIAKVNTG